MTSNKGQTLQTSGPKPLQSYDVHATKLDETNINEEKGLGKAGDNEGQAWPNRREMRDSSADEIYRIQLGDKASLIDTGKMETNKETHKTKVYTGWETPGSEGNEHDYPRESNNLSLISSPVQFKAPSGRKESNGQAQRRS